MIPTLAETTLALTFGLTAGCMVWDAGEFRIPNKMLIAIIACFVMFSATTLPLPEIGWRVGISLIALVGGMLLFAMRAFGAGDAKLLAAVILWVAPAHALGFVALIGLLGGVLTIGIVVARMLLVPFNEKYLPKLLCHKQPLPYGLAIGGAFLNYLW